VSERERETRIDAEVRAAREEYAEEEAEAAEAEIAEQNAALDVSLNLRITRGLDARLRRRAPAPSRSPPRRWCADFSPRPCTITAAAG
jgi:hypothetical protein